MKRRAVLLGSGAMVAGAVALRADTGPLGGSGTSDIGLGIEAARSTDEFLCRLTFRPAESGKLHERTDSFKRGTLTTIKVGEGRPDGSSIDLTVAVSVDPSGDRAECAVTITDRGKIVTIQRTSVALPRA
jgi:hypothetical protein